MVVFNPSKKEIGAKIVYYGPAAGGKTTNLQFVHQKLNPNQRGEMVSLATRDDRTLFFDFLPLDLGSVKGFKTRFHLYTVPGQVYYVSTRRAVLTGVDGVIFVADSQASKLAENIESLEDLENNLQYYGKNMKEIPMMLQYNKRDLNDLSTIEVLNEKLNKRNLPFLEAIAVSGHGVMETLSMITKSVLESLEESSKKPRISSRKRAAVRPAQAPPPVPHSSAPAEGFIDLDADEQVQDVGILHNECRAAANEGCGGVNQNGDVLGFVPSGEAIDSSDSLAFDNDDGAVSQDFDATVDLDGENTSPDEPVAFKKIDEDISADADEPVEFAEFGYDELPIDDDDEPLDLEGFEEASVSAGVASEAPTEDSLPLEFEIPEEELDLDLELELESETESLIADEPCESDSSEASERYEMFEQVEDHDTAPEDNLLLGSEAEPLQDVQVSEEDSGVEIVHCGDAQLTSPISVRLPLRLRLKGNHREINIALTIQIDEDLLEL